MKKQRRTASTGWTTPLLAVAVSVASRRRRVTQAVTVTAPPTVVLTPRVDSPRVVTPRRRLRTLLVAVVHRALAVVSAFATVALLFIGLGPYSGRYRVVTVLSGSMRPSMPVGSMVVDTPIPLEKVKVGDVITFQAPIADHRVVSHRVVRVVDAGSARPTIITKGDGNAFEDPWEATLTSAPAWKVRAAIPWLGYAVIALRSTHVHRVLVYVVPTLLAGIWLISIWREPNAPPPRE